MGNVKAKHICTCMPKMFAILKSSANGWIIAKVDGALAETLVWGVKYCPFCKEELTKLV